MPRIDHDTEKAALHFIKEIAAHYDVADAIIFGSRARGDHRPDSDADLAVILHGPKGERTDVGIAMAGIAFDVLMDTGILVQPLPLWQDELDHPERFANPSLIENIRREGIRL